ncbi:MAG: hypothetical protein WC852_01035 [Candidatus Nanoarchaeia archaeon]|jgi:hypothetical protein
MADELHKAYESALDQAGKQASEKPKFNEEELKRINCMQTLKSYLEKMFADEKLEKLLFNSRDEIELYRAQNVEIDSKGTKANVVYGLNGVGAYRRLEDVNLFHNQFHFRWGHYNSAFALAYALMSDSKAELVPANLEDKIVSYLHKKAPAASVDIKTEFAALSQSR